MAQFDANINLNVNNREALKGVTQVEGAINKLVKGVKEFERIFNDALNPKAAVQSRFQLEQERKALTLFNQQNAALQNQVRLAAELGRAYDKLQVKIVGGELVRAEKARNAQKALPGAGFSGQRALPAAGQTGGSTTASPFLEAQRVAAAIDKLNAETVKEKARGNNAVSRTADAREKIARAAEGEVSRVTRTAPPGSGPASGVGSRGTSGERFRAKLEQQVAREISASGKLTRETEELVNTFNKRQNVGDKLIAKGNELVKITDQQVDAARNQTNKSKQNQKKQRGGGGGAGGGLAAGIGFPLLFGSGPGSIIGGALGSAGGFGTQILASAIGGIIDQAIADVAKLGQAFTKTGLDADALSKAIGDLSGSTKKLINETKEVSGSQAAAEAAAKLMAATIGDDAVTALTDLGDATNELGSATAILNTEFQALAAQLLGPVAQGVAGLLERTNLINAADRITAGGGEDAARIRAAAERGGENSDDPIQGAIDARLAETAKILAERRAEARQEITNANIENSKTLDILQNEESILNINGNLLNENVYKLEKANIELRTKAKLQQDNLTDLEKEVIKQERINELKGLDNKRAKEQVAANRQAEQAAAKAFRERERAAKELLRLQTELNQEGIKAIQISVKYATAFEGTEAGMDRQLMLLQREKGIKAQIIRDNTENLQIEKLKLDNLDLEYDILQKNLETSKQRLAVQRQLAVLQAGTSLAATERGLQQELSGITVNQSDGDALRQKQGDRYANTLAEINAKIAEQYVLIESTPTPDKQVIEQATLRLNQLQEESNLYKTLLPQIFAAEQAQLKYNQAFAAITPAVNSLVGGLREVVAGTKTAEEAFADFLNTVADQLIQTAATMIAQYIAIGIAKAFAGLSGDSPTTKGTLPGTNFFEARTPGLATGGTAKGGKAYIVGENGPELFIPGVTGTVSNNDQFEAARNALMDDSTGEALIENEEALGISSSNISSQGGNSSNYYSQNGSALAAISRSFAENNNTLSSTSSVMRDRSMERESENTTSSAGKMTIETQVINEVEYATVDQVAKASALAAKQARAQVFSDMKNKPSRRAAVGMR